MDYVILVAESFSGLEKQVIRHFKKGYVVAGGVAVVPTNIMSTGLMWTQAMISKEG